MISVVVPVYNTAKYLDRCIISIINQTYRDLQIILVDDGSNDQSGNICSYYTRKDDRIEVIHQENGGQAAARKIGILHSKGDFIINLDSDDWIDEDYINGLVSAQEMTGADIVAGNLFYEIGDCITVVSNGIDYGCYNQKEIIDKMVCKGDFFEYGIQPHLVTKLIDRKLLLKSLVDNDLKIRIGEDAAVVYSCVLNCKKICVADVCGYHYIQHQESMTKTQADKKEEVDSINTLVEYLYKRFEEAGVIDVLRWQLGAYRKYLFAMRCIDVFETDDKILKPYGTIQCGSKVVIYGAGVLGQQLYSYLLRKDVCITRWVDINYDEYRIRRLNVDNPEVLKDINAFDYILIANTNYTTAMTIKDYLMNKLNVDNSKIKWFSDEFINEQI